MTSRRFDAARAATPEHGEVWLPIAGGLGAVLALLILAPGLATAQERAPGESAPPRSVVADSKTGLLPEPDPIRRGIAFAGRFLASADGGDGRNGFYPELSNMITGAGWISAGPGYRQWLFRDHVFVDASAAMSWRVYKMAQARIELPRLARSRVALGSQVRWQDLTQITYFGEGPRSMEADRSEYRLTSTGVVGYATLRPAPKLAITGRVGRLEPPSLGSPVGPFRRGHPWTRDVFADDPVYGLPEQPRYLHGDVSITADTRDHAGYPSSGGVFRAAWISYSDRDAGTFSFDRYEAEAAHFVPLAARRVIVALHGWLVASDTAEGRIVPFYLLPSLGGANTLRSYANYRFHDRNLVVFNAESRVALFEHVDAVAFVDAGSVAPRVADLDLDWRSYGFGFRAHSRASTLARLDIAQGREGWRVVFRTSDVFRFSRLTRRTAAVPFVP